MPKVNPFAVNSSSTAPAAVEAAMRGAAAVVLLSQAEGVPRTLIEAAAAGAPIITTDAPGCRDTVIDRKSGFLCAVKAPAQVADAMARLLERPELIAAMGRKGRRLAVSRFDRAQVIEATLAVYERQLQRERQPLMPRAGVAGAPLRPGAMSWPGWV